MGYFPYQLVRRSSSINRILPRSIWSSILQLSGGTSFSMICLASAAMTHWLFAIVEASQPNMAFLGSDYWELDWGPVLTHSWTEMNLNGFTKSQSRSLLFNFDVSLVISWDTGIPLLLINLGSLIMFNHVLQQGPFTEPSQREGDPSSSTGLGCVISKQKRLPCLLVWDPFKRILEFG